MTDIPARRLAVRAGIAILIAPFIAGAWILARRELRTAIDYQFVELEAISTLKALQLSEWHRERLDDATGRAQDPLFVASVRAWVNGDRSPELAQRIQGSITPKRVPWRYINIWLLAPDGSLLFNARKSADPFDVDRPLIAECLRSRAPVLAVIAGLETSAPFLDMCSSVMALDQAAGPAGAYVQRIDATQLLMPTIAFWPRPRESAGTVIVRRTVQGFETVLSSNPRDKVAAPPSRIPREWLSSPDLSSGHLGGTDGDGNKVLGVVRGVPNTDWSVILSIGRAETESPAYEEIGIAALLTALLIVTGYLGTIVVSDRNQRRNAAQILRMDRLLQVRSAINEAIVRIQDRDLMLSRFCEIAVAMGRFEFAVILELPSDRRTVRLKTWYGALPERFGSSHEFPLDEGLRNGPLSPLFERGSVVIIADLTKERPDRWTQSLVDAGHRAVVVVPIRERGVVSGLFGLYSSEMGAFDHRDAQLFDELAGDIAYALENVEADKHRRAVEAQLHAVSDAAPFAIFLVGQEDDRIVRVNQAALRQYGYSEDELVGRAASIIFAPHELMPSLPLGERTYPLPLTTTHERKDGKVLTVEVTTRPIAIGGRAALVAVAVDVTERRELEEQYRQAQRLEAVGKLAGGIAHDFNNLLTVIGGFSSFVLEDLPPDSPARSAAQQIQIAADRASALTSRLLAFSRRQMMVTQHVALNHIVKETAVMLGRLISEDVVLELKLDARRDLVNVDPAQMQQVIMNLAVNARDAMKKGGRLTIATADRDDESAAGAVELRVADTGSGIEPAVLEHIFEPFFTTKPPDEGTGLGLPTVHGIVVQSGGQISVETVVGQGTAFVMRFPRVERLENPTTRPEPPPARLGHGTILLVEDDAGVRALTRLVLARGGYDVVECANGAAALDRATAMASGSIDLLLTDVVMPGMSGPELVTRLKSYHPGLTALFVSGYAEDAAARLGLDLHTLDLLRKPFVPQELLQRVDAAMRRI